MVHVRLRDPDRSREASFREIAVPQAAVHSRKKALLERLKTHASYAQLPDSSKK